MQNKKELTVVKPRGKFGHIPNSDAITKCMQFKTPDALSYLYNRLVTIFDDTKMRTEAIDKNVLEPVASYRDYITQANAGENIWSGKAPSSAYLEYLLKDVVKSFDVLSEKQIEFDFAVGDSSELVRRYSSPSGNDLDANSIQAMDNIFNAWLAQNKMFSKGGVIYEGTPATQNPKEVGSETLRDKVVDEKSGYGAFVAQHYKSMKMTVNELPYPKSEQPGQNDDTGPASGAGQGA